MTKEKKRAPLFIALILIGAYLVSFLLYYLSSYVIGASFLNYFTYFYQDTVTSLFTLIALSLILVKFSEKGCKAALIAEIKYALIPMIYSLPYYAFRFAYLEYEIGAVILLSVGISLLYSITVYAIVALLLFIYNFAVKKLTRKKEKGARNSNVECTENNSLSAFDFSIPHSVGIACAAGVVFVYNLIYEIIDTVGFLTSYSGTYTFGEIIYIMARYLFILFIFLISQYLSCLVYRLASRK